MLTVYEELQVVLLVQVGLNVHAGEYAGPQPPQLEVCRGQESLAGEGEVAGRRVNTAPPNLYQSYSVLQFYLVRGSFRNS